MYVVGTLLVCSKPLTRLANITLEIATRKIKPYPNILAGDGQRVEASLVENLDVVTTILLVVVLQLWTMLLNPRLKRTLLNLLEGHFWLVDARNSNKQRS